MDQYTTTHLRELLAILKRFLIQERLAYRTYTSDARYNKQAQHARRASHRVLSYLVPRFRLLDKLLNQRNATAKAAPQLLAATLIQCFIAKTRTPDTHPVWQAPITSDHLRALVALGPVPWQTWLTRWEQEFPGITETLCNSQVGTLRNLRTAYLARGALADAQQQEKLSGVLERVKAMLPVDDYQLLLANLRTPA